MVRQVARASVSGLIGAREFPAARSSGTERTGDRLSNHDERLSSLVFESPEPDEWDDIVPSLDRSPGHWFGVAATLVIAAPTRAAAQELADVIARERLPRLLDFSVYRHRLVGRHHSGGLRGHTAMWVAEVVLALKATTAEEARHDVERVCRRDVAGSHLFLDFGPARRINVQDRLSAMCRRLVADATNVLAAHLWDDLADFGEGMPFEDAWCLPECLPVRFKSAYDIPFIERWIGTVETVGLDLLRYPHSYLACTAEELAAHAIIDQARAQLDNVGETPEGEKMRGQLAEELDMLHNSAFEDHDILMAFGSVPCPADDLFIAEVMNIANFTPDLWFKPFRETDD